MTVTTDREVLTVLDDLYQAWVDNDADAFVAAFTPDATSILSGSSSVGPMARAFAGPLQGSHVRDEVQSVRHLGDDAALVVTRSVVVLADQTEADAVMATWTLTRQEGLWRIAAYHSCPA